MSSNKFVFTINHAKAVEKDFSKLRLLDWEELENSNIQASYLIYSLECGESGTHHFQGKPKLTRPE